MPHLLRVAGASWGSPRSASTTSTCAAAATGATRRAVELHERRVDVKQLRHVAREAKRRHATRRQGNTGRRGLPATVVRPNQGHVQGRSPPFFAPCACTCGTGGSRCHRGGGASAAGGGGTACHGSRRELEHRSLVLLLLLLAKSRGPAQS